MLHPGAQESHCIRVDERDTPRIFPPKTNLRADLAWDYIILAG